MPRIFVGKDASGSKRFVELERHALTVAGSGGGKGSCQITPNLKGEFAWQESVVVIDPKGEAANLTAEYRAKELGQEVAVLDPFHYATAVPDELRKTFNPFDLMHYAENLNSFADGLIVRHANDSQPFFNSAAKDLLAGLCGYLCEAPSIPDHERNLASLLPLFDLVRSARPPKPKKADEDGQEEFEASPGFEILEEMKRCHGFGGLPSRTAAKIINAESGLKNAYETLDTQLAWLASERMQAWLAQPSTVDLHQLKHGKLSVYLVIPPDMLVDQAQFLRSFVSLMLKIMWEKMPDGSEMGTRCLFLLDEFPALGKMEALRIEALPLGRSFGLHVWPFLQYWNQLTGTYGRDEAEAFIANCDLFCVFAPDDRETPRVVSEMMGMVGEADIYPQVLAYAGRIDDTERLRFQQRSAQPRTERQFHSDQFAKTALHLTQSTLGRPRVAPDTIIEKTAIDPRTKVARKLLVRTRGNKWEFLTPIPYFAQEYDPAARRLAKQISWGLAVIAAVAILVLVWAVEF